MKIRVFFLMLVFGLLFFAACSDDDKKEGNEPAKIIVQEFQKQFPDAKNVVWSEKNGYQVATFDLLASRAAANAGKNEAWFKDNGKCVMSELELSVEELPAVVKAGFEASAYAAYAIDDIDLLERDGQKIYKIEAEQGTEEWDLFFDAEGRLLKAVPDTDDSDDDDENRPTPDEIVSYLQEKYQDVQIIECEWEEEKGVKMYEVEFLDADKVWDEAEKEYENEKEALFDADKNWVRTVMEVAYSKIPQVVRTAFETAYPDADTDEAELWEQPDGNYYVFEIEDAQGEKNVFFKENGEEKE